MAIKLVALYQWNKWQTANTGESFTNAMKESETIDMGTKRLPHSTVTSN